MTNVTQRIRRTVLAVANETQKNLPLKGKVGNGERKISR